MRSYKVSVLLSVYNGAGTIQRSLNSLVDQTYDDYEIIVINDGSTDDTANILDKYSFDRLKVYHLEHVGLPKALNYGLKKCQGEYIARMDADDWSHPSRIELQANWLDNNPDVDVVSCLVEYGGNREENLGYALHVDWINTLVADKEIKANRFEDSPIANPSSMFRSSLIKTYGNYSEAPIPEDYEFWLRLMDADVKFHKIDKCLLKWSDLPSRITRNHSNYSQENFFKVKSAYLAKWIKKNFDIPPKLYVFGNGKEVRRKADGLKAYNLKVSKFTDIQMPTKSDVIYFEDLPTSTGDILVLSYIGDRKGKKQINEFLESRGYEKGYSYFMMN